MELFPLNDDQEMARYEHTGGDFRIIDDPHTLNEDLPESRLEIQHAWDFVALVMPTHVRNVAQMPREIIIGQWVVGGDVSAYILLEGTHDAPG